VNIIALGIKSHGQERSNRLL